jgi:nucleotide-binding universal stress UspA family protein
MKILIAIDESSHSLEAIDFVCKLRWPTNTRVLVVSAIPFAVYATTEVYLPASGPSVELLEETTRKHEALVSRAEAALGDAGLATETRVPRGDPREVIVQMAKDEGADLIVLGSHGHTGMARLLMGSVASHVVSHAPCSVLMVKHDRIRP